MIHHIIILYQSHPLLVMITSVSQDTYIQDLLFLVTHTHFILMTHSGMVMDVTPVVPAAHSTILQISPNTLTTHPTTDDIELRLCCYNPLNGENVAVELVEI